MEIVQEAWMAGYIPARRVLRTVFWTLRYE